MSRATRLLADIGGTHARFALQAGSGTKLSAVETLRCAEHATLSGAIEHYLHCHDAAPTESAIAIATPITGDRVRMTNHDWSFSIEQTRLHFGWRRLEVINDFSALALALPLLGADESRQIGGGAAVPDMPIGLIGPGTGLGISALLPGGHGGWIALHGEGGHATLPACTPREQAVLEYLRARYGHASAERALSGPGLAAIHAALRTIDRASPAAAGGDLDAPSILARAIGGNDERCQETVDLFCAFLGTAAGNLALTLDARGGVFIGGGIVPRLGGLFDRSPFRARFEAKGRFADYLAAIPVRLIVANESPALRGAARALDSARRC